MIIKQRAKSDKIVVSLTTWPKRIPYIEETLKIYDIDGNDMLFMNFDTNRLHK